LFFHIPALACGQIGKTLFEQGFFYGVYAGGTQYILNPCFMSDTGNVKSVFGKTADTVFTVVGKYVICYSVIRFSTAFSARKAL
jgi:hypothetical protein